MRIPPKYELTTLEDLGRLVRDGPMVSTFAPSFDVGVYSGHPEVETDVLEMTKAQYVRYKELVWDGIRRQDPIRFFNGLEIKLSTA